MRFRRLTPARTGTLFLIPIKTTAFLSPGLATHAALPHILSDNRSPA
ncbi:hypothetical protein SAMN05880582_1011135 [Rhizobium sp. RU20A]|nr:hypothetical protein SAMN05880582_1011135 [Rhizobium sp. RU20A]